MSKTRRLTDEEAREWFLDSPEVLEFIAIWYDSDCNQDLLDSLDALKSHFKTVQEIEYEDDDDVWEAG